MGIFTRLRDIIGSNINAMLDRAEDPEKLIRLIIQEMEDTLVEIKQATAGAMAGRKKIERELEAIRARADEWEARAEMAIDKGREDLAREALLEKRRFQQRADDLEMELAEAGDIVSQYQADIRQLEEKLSSVRERQRNLLARHRQAVHKRRAQQDIRRASSADVVTRFEAFEQRVERMEAEADLVNYGRKPDLEEQFMRLAGDDEIEEELARLKEKRTGTEQAAD